MARYDTLTNAIADLSSVPQVLTSGPVQAQWKKDEDGKVCLSIHCIEARIPENLTTVMECAAELCKQADIPISLTFDRTQFGSRDELRDNVQRLLELSRPVERQLPPPAPPIIETQWTSTPTYTSTNYYPTETRRDEAIPKGFGWFLFLIAIVIAVAWGFWHL